MSTTFLPHPNADGLVRIIGQISNYKCTRASASFVFTETDQTKMGVIAVAAGLAGLSGQAISTAASASDMEEAANYVEFSLGERQIKGWVWRSPFKDGDTVEVAAEPRSDHFESFGIARPGDKVVALYPHCSRGRTRHIKNAVKWWLMIAGGFNLGVCLLLQAASRGQGLHDFIEDGVLQWGGLGTFTFFGLMVFSMTRQWLPFVKLAEKVFIALDFTDPSNVDLVKSSKKSRTPQDPPEFGTFYFRY